MNVKVFHLGYSGKSSPGARALGRLRQPDMKVISFCFGKIGTRWVQLGRLIRYHFLLDVYVFYRIAIIILRYALTSVLQYESAVGMPNR